MRYFTARRGVSTAARSRPVLWAPVMLALLMWPALGELARAQDGDLFHGPQLPPQIEQGGGRRQSIRPEMGSLLYRQLEPVKVLQINDLVTVVVDIRSRAISEGEVENRKRASLEATLLDWIKLDGLRAVFPDPQTRGDPKVNGQLNSQFRSEAELETRNALTFTIAAKVVDVRPNGNLVIEARQTFHNNEEVWERSLNGIIRREDVDPDNRVNSEDIAELRVFKRELGHVRDGYRRGWLQRFYEKFQPF